MQPPWNATELSIGRYKFKPRKGSCARMHRNLMPASEGRVTLPHPLARALDANRHWQLYNSSTAFNLKFRKWLAWEDHHARSVEISANPSHRRECIAVCPLGQVPR